MNYKTEFINRWDTRYPSIESLYKELYGEKDDELVGLTVIKDILESKFSERKDDLKTEDRKREANPGWFLSNKWVGMMLYVDRFAGNLQNLDEKLNYLDDLGINLIHLMPLWQRRNGDSDGGYAVSNYEKVDSQFGTNDDLERFISKVHQKGGLAMLDMVLNHTADDHEWAKKALGGDQEFLDYYYHFDSESEKEDYNRFMPEIFPNGAPGSFTYVEEIQKWLCTVFYHFQWDLNFRNPRVVAQIISALLTLSNMGIDLIRLDAVIFIWKEKGTNCQNLPEVHKILKLIKLCTSVVSPELLFVAEAISRQEEVVPYLGNEQERECELAYNASLMGCLWDSLLRENTDILYHVHGGKSQKPSRSTWLNYIRCHDDIALVYEDSSLKELGYNSSTYRNEIAERFTGDFPNSISRGLLFMSTDDNPKKRIASSLASLCGLEKAIEENSETNIELALKRMDLLHAVILSYGGLPMIYAGDELATINDYSFQEDPELAHDTRWSCRPLMNWEIAEERNIEGTVANRSFQSLKKLIRLRQGISEFSDRNDSELINNDNKSIMVYQRGVRDRVICLCNFSSSDQKTEYRFPKGNCLITGKEFTGEEKELILSPYDYLWIKVD